MRAEMESFEYEPIRTGVRYAAPEGLRDDCVVALALAVEKGRSACEPFVFIVHPVAPRGAPARPGETVQQYYDRMRLHDEWGWEPVRWTQRRLIGGCSGAAPADPSDGSAVGPPRPS